MLKIAKLFVVISGNIGSGKTIFTRLLCQELGWRGFYEKIIDNPYLNLFYQEMKMYAFPLQIHIVANKIKAQNEINKCSVSCIQDRSIYEDAEVFTRIQHEDGYISEIDYGNYATIFSALEGQIRKPDLIIYLKSSVDRLIKKILNRGRGFEQAIDPLYLDRLDKVYEQWIIDKKNDGLNVLEVDTEICDFEENKNDLQGIVNYIKEMEKQICLDMD